MIISIYLYSHHIEMFTVYWPELWLLKNRDMVVELYPPIHPNCRCDLGMEVPKAFHDAFSEEVQS
jgi:hypothetical protein